MTQMFEFYVVHVHCGTEIKDAWYVKWETITWSNFTWHFHLIEFFDQTPKFKAFDRIIWSTAKICQFFFVSWSKVLIMVFYNFKLLKLSIKWKNPSVLFWHLIETFNNAYNTIIRTFDQVPKKNLRILAVDQMYCWLRNWAKN